MDQQRDDSVGPDGRQRQENERADTELKAKQSKTKPEFLCAAGGQRTTLRDVCKGVSIYIGQLNRFVRVSIPINN